jgi:hypothetical protein
MVTGVMIYLKKDTQSLRTLFLENDAIIISTKCLDGWKAFRGDLIVTIAQRGLKSIFHPILKGGCTMDIVSSMKSSCGMHARKKALYSSSLQAKSAKDVFTRETGVIDAFAKPDVLMKKSEFFEKRIPTVSTDCSFCAMGSE